MDYQKVVVVIEGLRYALVPLDPPASKTSLDDIDMPAIARNALKAAGIECLEQVLEMTEVEILRKPHVGRKALNALRHAAHQKGWWIGQFHRREP
jgi:DNA-directed RNA polymerase alpha subunit